MFMQVALVPKVMHWIDTAPISEENVLEELDVVLENFFTTELIQF